MSAELLAITKGQRLNDHVTRYHLSNGWFIDKETVRALQHYGYRYGVWEPGAGETIHSRDGSTYQVAAYRTGADTLQAARIKATLAKEREV